MKANLLLFLTASLAVLPAFVPVAATASEAVRKPNVIVILTDDQGSVDANCYGAKDLVTPAIDALAARGVRFTQFYAGSAVCSPSRAALLTGRYPVRAGMPGNAGSIPVDMKEPGTGQSRGMPTEQVTIAETLKAAGYATAQIGKWHLGHGEGKTPGQQGFDHWFGHLGGCIDNYSHFFYWNGPNRHDLWRNGKRVHAAGSFFPDMMVKEAEQFIQANKDRPFFIYFALNCPHYPYQGDAKWLKHYKDTPYPRNLYAAFVSTLDERIGQLLAVVDQAGLREDTIVIYQSDHGHSTEGRAHGGGGSAGPYRGAKFSLFEGGIRVPAVISWPGHIPEGETRAQLAHGCDWLPTITDLCGTRLLEPDIDGKSLADVITSNDTPTPHKVAHWKMGAQWAVREGDWKLIGNPSNTGGKGTLGKDDKLFLVNLAEDETEMTNTAARHPDRVKKLKRLHDEWENSLLREKAVEHFNRGQVSEAVRFWEKGARLGDDQAAGRLAQLLYEGDGVPIDRKRAIELWEAAARGAPPDNKNPALAPAFARIMTGDPKTAKAARKQIAGLARGGNRAAVDAMKYLAARENPDVLLLDVPHIRQAHNYCAAGSAAMMLRYQGINVSQFDVHGLCPNTKEGDGVYWSDLVVAVGECGGNWEIKTHPATEEGFAEAKAFVVGELSAGRPMIIDWFDKTNAHTVVLCGYDRKSKEFFFRNTGLPYPGIHVRPESWIKKNWATGEYIPNNKVKRRAAIRIVDRTPPPSPRDPGVAETTRPGELRIQSK